MTVQTETVRVPFGKGISTKTSGKIIPAGKLQDLKNGVFEAPGALSTRAGNVIIDTGGHFSGRGALATLRGELTAMSAVGLSSFVDADKTWLNKGIFTPIKVDSQVLVSTLTAQTSCDGCAGSSAAGTAMEVYAYEQGAGISVTVRDTVTGNVTLQDFQIAADGILPRCVFFGNKLYVFYIDVGTSHLNYVSLLTKTTFTAPTAIFLVYATTKLYDLCVWNTAGTHLAIAYNNNAGALTVSTYTTAIALESTLVVGGAPTIIAVNELPSASKLGVATYVGGAINGKTFQNPAAIAAVATSVQAVVGVKNLAVEDRTVAAWRVYW